MRSLLKSLPHGPTPPYQRVCREPRKPVALMHVVDAISGQGLTVVSHRTSACLPRRCASNAHDPSAHGRRAGEIPVSEGASSGKSRGRRDVGGVEWAPATPHSARARGVAGMSHGLASDRQVTTIDPLDALDTLGQLMACCRSCSLVTKPVKTTTPSLVSTSMAMALTTGSPRKLVFTLVVMVESLTAPPGL